LIRLNPVKHKPAHPAAARNATSSVGPRQSGISRRWFRIAAAVIVPCLLLVVIEGALRMAGFGHPTSFFVRLPGAGDNTLVENGRFGWRFFPREAARSPSPLRIHAAKAAGTIRIFVLGESAALGDPKPAYGVGRYLEVLLKERFPGSKFEVVCVAMTAINSHAILPIARECARLQGDAWVVYMGNNEMEGPFGANTVFGPTAPGLPFIRATLALKATRLGQGLEDLGRRLKSAPDQPANWEGMKTFLRQQLPPEDSRRKKVYAHFQRNLEDIVRAALDSGARPVLCTVASNLKDCAPFASLHRDGLAADDLATWKKLYEQARQLESTNRFQEAGVVLGEAGRLDAAYAELQFRAGACALDLTNILQARLSFTRARDVDALPFRTDTAINAVTREVAGRFAGRGVALVDAEAELAAQSPQGIPGQEFFYDHVHLNFDGNYRLARLLAAQVEKSLPALSGKTRAPEWASPETCALRLGLTDWNRSAAWESMLQRMADAPFTNQLNHTARTRMMVEAIRGFRSGMKQESAAEARTVYENAIRQAPGDHRLAENFAEFLEQVGALNDAVGQWRQVERVLPHHQAAPFQIGRLLARLGRWDEARESLLTSLRLRPDLAEAHLELGQIALAQKKNEEAVGHFEVMKRLRPEDSRVRLLLGKTLAAQNDHAGAIASLIEAVRLRPRYWEAHYLLGVEFAILNRFAEAQAAFAEVIRLRPDYPSAHFNLGVSFAKQGRSDQATAEFMETLRLDPKHASAVEYLQALRSTGNAPK
jgi:tetratricopeptide (TPR) repeat protein